MCLRLSAISVLLAVACGLTATAQPPVAPPAIPSVMIPDDPAIARMTEAGVRFAAGQLPQRKVFLGRVAAPNNKPNKSVALSKYVIPVKSPASVDWGKKAGSSLSRMYVNDQLGCCVISSVYHRIGTWSGNDSPVCQVVSDQVIRDVYRKLAYIPGQDTGCIISDVLEAGVRDGYPLADGTRAKLDGYASVDNRNKELVKVWISEFGGGPIGMNLPRGWSSGGAGSTWGAVSGADAQVVGGHDVHVFGYDDTGVMISTWGGTRKITWAAFTKRPTGFNDWGISEAWCPLSPLWYGSDSLTPNGVNVVKLKKDLQTIRDGGIPIDDPIIPPPPPPPDPKPPLPGAGFTGTLTYSGGVLTAVTPGVVPPAPKIDPAAIEAAVKGAMDRALTDAATGVKALNWADLIAAIVKAIMEALSRKDVGIAPKPAVKYQDIGFGIMVAEGTVFTPHWPYDDPTLAPTPPSKVKP